MPICNRIPIKNNASFPINTLIINVFGAFLIGFIVAFADRSKILSPKLVLFLKVGICGGFTTFSTFAFEFNNMLSANHIFSGILYAVLIVAIGTFAVNLGMTVSKLL